MTQSMRNTNAENIRYIWSDRNDYILPACFRSAVDFELRKIQRIVLNCVNVNSN